MATLSEGLKAARFQPLSYLFKRPLNQIQEIHHRHCPLVSTGTGDLWARRSCSHFVPCNARVGRFPALVQTTVRVCGFRVKWACGPVLGLNFRQNSSDSNSNTPWVLRPPPSPSLQHPSPSSHEGKASKLRQTSLKLKETKEKVKEKMEEMIDKENILTIPNLLCVTRIGLSPVLGYLVLQHSYHYALGIFVFAGVTDLLDGIIARHFPSQQSMIGSFLDPMADKLLIALLFLSLTATELIPVPLTILIITRDVCLMYAGFYVRYLSLPPPKTWSRYFDATFATAKLSPTLVSKINTSVQLTLVACTLAAPVFDLVNHPVLQILWYVTAATTVTSGLSYVACKDTYKLLRQAKRGQLGNELPPQKKQS